MLALSRHVTIEDAPPQTTTNDGTIVWRRIHADRQALLAHFGDRIYPSYAHGLSRLALPAHRFPRRSELDAALAPVGWRIAWVPGFIPGREFARLIGDRCFPVAANVRPVAHIDHAPTPDAIHDIWGHLPLLFDEEYTDYLCDISNAMAAAPQDGVEAAIFGARESLGDLTAGMAPVDEIEEARLQLVQLEAREREHSSLFTRLSRLFLWSIEFGLIGAMNQPKVLGAAILSSVRECHGMIFAPPPIRSFDLACTDHDILFTEPQAQVFVARDISDYRLALSRLLAEER